MEEGESRGEGDDEDEDEDKNEEARTVENSIAAVREFPNSVN